MEKKTKRKKKEWERDCGDCNFAFDRELKMQIAPTMKDFYFLTFRHRISRKISIPFTFFSSLRVSFLLPFSLLNQSTNNVANSTPSHGETDSYANKQCYFFSPSVAVKPSLQENSKTSLLCSTFKKHTTQEITITRWRFNLKSWD